MLRVIYQWKIDPARREDFVKAWRMATRNIHSETPGALGSFCLETLGTPETLLTVALWQSEADWRAFISSARKGPMRTLHEIGELISATPYMQLGDETISVGAPHLHSEDP